MAKSKEGLAVTYVPLSEVIEWKSNPKAHQDEAIQGSVRRFGFLDPIGMNTHKDANFLLEGHGRLAALREMHDKGESPPANIIIGETPTIITE